MELISHVSLVFLWYMLITHEPLDKWVYQENTSDNWDIPWWYVLFHAIENAVANTINAIYAQRMMGRLDVTPLIVRGTAFLYYLLALFLGIIESSKSNSFKRDSRITL